MRTGRAEMKCGHALEIDLLGKVTIRPRGVLAFRAKRSQPAQQQGTEHNHQAVSILSHLSLLIYHVGARLRATITGDDWGDSPRNPGADSGNPSRRAERR